MLGNLKKYAAVLWISYKNHSVYVYDVIGINVIYVLRTLIILLLFKAVYALGYGHKIGFSLQQLAWSLIFVQALVTSNPRISDEVNAEIKDGQITKYLIYPLSYVDYKFLEHFSRFAYNLTFTLLIGFGVGYLMLGGIETSVPGFFAGMTLVFGALFINFFGYMLIGLTAFFTGDSRGFRTIYSAFDRLLAGNIVPIPMFPLLLQKIIFLSPFAYTGYSAGLIFVKYSNGDFIRYCSMQILWSSVLYVGCRWLYRRALVRLVIHGG